MIVKRLPERLIHRWVECTTLAKPGSCPSDISLRHDDSISYSMVLGQRPTDLLAVHDALRTNFWTAGTRCIARPQAYMKRMSEIGLDIVNPILESWPFTGAHCVHGDATMSNFVQRYLDGSVCAIDFGDNYKLNCIELDEAKLLMSWAGWDAAQYGSFVPKIESQKLPFKVTKGHWALYATHCARALRYAHPTGSLARGWLQYNLEKGLRECGLSS